MLKNVWVKTADSSYYFGNDGEAFKNASMKIGRDYYIFDDEGRLCTGQKRIVYLNGAKYLADRNGRAISGWNIYNANAIYTDKSGKLACGKRVSYIDIGGDCYAKDKWQAFAKIYARKFIDSHTRKKWSKKKKLHKCFWYIEEHMTYIHGYVPDKKAYTTNGWQYRAACDMLSSRKLTGNCRSFAASIAAIAKELGYEPVVYSMKEHSVVKIGSKWYDNMYNGRCGKKKLKTYKEVKMKFKF